MGSGIEYMDPAKEGILPRAIMHIFQRCTSYEREAEEKGISSPKFTVSCQFIEVSPIVSHTFLSSCSIEMITTLFHHRSTMKVSLICSIKKIWITVLKRILTSM